MTGYLSYNPANNTYSDFRGKDINDNIITPLHNANNQLSFWRLYDNPSLGNINTPYDETLNRANAIANLNNGGALFGSNFHLVYHMDHSSAYNMSTSSKVAHDYLSRADVSELNNGLYYQVFFTGGCSPNSFDFSDGISEHYLSNTGGGAVSFIGSTSTSYASDLIYYKMFCNTLYLNNNSRIANALYTATSSNKDYRRRVALLGDPSMDIWTCIPQIFQIAGASQVCTGEQTISTTISGLAFGARATVCLYKKDEVYEVEYVIGTGSPLTVDIVCTPDTPGQMALTITAHNYIPVEKTINVVINPGTHLFVSTNTVNDDAFGPSNGNNNGIIDAGETIELITTVSNQGMTAANSVTASLSANSSFVTVNQANSSFGTINALGNKQSSPYYVVHVSPNTPDHEMVKLNYNIMASGGVTFNDTYSVEIHAPLPRLTITALTTTINNDNIIDPGDHVSLDFTLYNAGSGVASNLTGTLTTTSPYIQNITSSTQSFGSIHPSSTGSNSSPFEFNVTSAYNGQSIELTLTLNTGIGSQWAFPINLEFPPAISNLKYTGTNTSISLFWDAISTAKGYNVYRSDNSSGTYTKINNTIIEGFSGYTDDGLTSLTTYYYKVAAVSQSGLQGPLTAPMTAWTTLPYHTDWPMTAINVDVYGGRSEGSPTAYDTNNDGIKDIFFTTSDGNGTIGGIFGFHHDMEELYDIDQNPTTVSGFYVYNNAGSNSTPAIGDINNDGIQEIITTTKNGMNGTDTRKVIVHSTLDSNADGKPDRLWSKDIGGPDTRGACLSDLNNDGELEIMVKSDWSTPFQVFSANGTNYPGWPVNLDKDGFTMPAACDLDNDGFKEVIFGCKDGIYIFNHDGTPFLSTSSDGLFFSYSSGNTVHHMDSAPVFVDLNDDGYYEMIWVSGQVSSQSKGRVFALDRFGNFVQNWGYDDHIINITNMGSGILWLPNPSVGTIDYNGNKQLVVTIAEQGKIYCWIQNGAPLSNFPITVPGLQSKFISPLIADIDDDDDLELIVSSNSTEGGIYAFNFDGSPVVGWPLRVKSFSTPHISDIDNDGKNEIIATAATECHVWKTEGDTDKIEWGSCRKDSYNSGIYNNICRWDDQAVVIQSNEVWDNEMRLSGSIYIEQGATLTIKAKVEMPTQSKIIVQRGARLVIEDAVNTSNPFCGTLWRGIEVQGNSNTAQPPFTNHSVLVINGGTIENAECGIRTWKPIDGTNTPDPNYSGGLVVANDANFLNNIVAVEFLPYSYSNFSKFKKCNFTTNAKLPNGDIPDYFVRLNGVNNVRFLGCNFINTYIDQSDATWGSGIYASDADLYIDQACTDNSFPCTEYQTCTFTNLYRGIYAISTTQYRNTLVHHAKFINTFRGMYLGNIDFASIKRNDFEAIGEVPGLNAIGYGLYLDASTAFAIEENYFHSPTSIRKGIGLIINEAGPDNNEVYNNRFENLQNGSIAQGYNRQSGGSVDGLCYKCNDFINNATDIRISPRSIRQLTNSDGIAYHQGANIPGDNLAPAGNTFTTTSNLKDINNTCNWIIYYRHHYGPASLLPNPADLTTNYQVFGTTYNKTISCPSRIGTGTGKEETRLAMEGAESQASDIQSSLDALIDGGSTPELHQEVINSTPDEGLLLRNQLLADSPYLSDTILKTSINKEEVLNNAMIRDVLVANPQSAKSAQMVEMLDGRIVPMTDEMKNEVLSGQTTTSSKENLEATLSSYKHEVWVNFVNLCNLYAGDTLHTWQSDTMGVLLAGANTPGTRYQLAFWQLFKGNPATAQQVMGNIPSEFTLDAGEQALHNRYATLLNELIAFDNNPEMLLEPGTDIYEALMELSNSGEDKPAALSRNLLLSAGLIEYDEPIKLDDGLKTMPVYKPGVQAAQSQKLKVYPNPANTFVTVSWNAPEQGNTTLVIHDANGRKVLTRPLQGLHNETIVDITGFVQGTYTVSLSQGGKTIATETLVIAK